MKSQYLVPYKKHVLSKILIGELPYSVSTFLKYKLKGNAKNWSGRYSKSLKKGLEKEGWVQTESILGGLAYKPS